MLFVGFSITIFFLISAKAQLSPVLPYGFGKWEHCSIGTPFDPKEAAGRSSYAQIYVSMKAMCHGTIDSWWYYNAATIPYVPIYLTVWQPLKSGSSHYYMVGFNKVNTTLPGWHKIEVPPEEQIVVRPDYVIGFHYDTPRLQESHIVIPNVEFTNLKVTKHQLQSLIAAPLGHFAIMEEQNSNRYVDLAYGIQRQRRIPALLAHVKKRVERPNLITTSTSSPNETGSTRSTRGSTASSGQWTAATQSTATQNTATQSTATQSPADATSPPAVTNGKPLQSSECFFPRNVGNATCAQIYNNSPAIRWFYDYAYSYRCQMFVSYTGICKGNANNFANYQECAADCERISD